MKGESNEDLDVGLPEWIVNEKVNISPSRDFVMKWARLYRDDSNFKKKGYYSGGWIQNLRKNDSVEKQNLWWKSSVDHEAAKNYIKNLSLNMLQKS